MARNPRRIDAELQELYDKVPTMKDCKGKCADSCGVIEASVRETERIERAAGRKLQGCPIDCSMLTPLGRCSQYELRPMICRIFGTTAKLRCEHGCVPEFWLGDEEAFLLLLRSFEVGGPQPGMKVDKLRQAIDSPRIQRWLADFAYAQRIIKSMKGGGLDG